MQIGRHHILPVLFTFWATSWAIAQLRRFYEISIETYKGGALLKWLEEPVARLDANRVDKSPAIPRAE